MIVELCLQHDSVARVHYRQVILVITGIEAGKPIDVKNVFYVFFILVTFLRFLTFFYFPDVFYLKDIGKVQSGKQINKKHFQNNSNVIDL